MPETIQRSFVGGEISPSLHSRADLTKYTSGLAACVNMFIRSQGGAYTRAGLRYIGEVQDSNNFTRLIDFSFNTEQTYALVFGDETMRVVKDGGIVLENDGVTIFEIPTPYTSDELSRLAYVQRADVMTLTHPDHSPYQLSRLADNDWTIELIDFDSNINPPEFPDFYSRDINDISDGTNVIVQTTTDHDLVSGQLVGLRDIVGISALNDRTYTVDVLTSDTFQLVGIDGSSLPIYDNGGEVIRGSTISFGEGAGDYTKRYTYGITAINANGEESIMSEPVGITTESLSTTAGVRIFWEPVEGATYYRIYKDPSNDTGIFGYIGISSSTSFDDFNIAPITSDTPPVSRNIFSVISGDISDIDLSNYHITTTLPHGLTSGEEVTVTDISQPVDFNGVYSVRVIDSTTFVYVDSGITSPLLPYTGGGTFVRDAEYPATANYYQQRLVFANTNLQKQTVFTTQTSNYDSLRVSVPARDDDAITFSIAAREVNEIRHVVELNSMILLTSGGVFRVTEGIDEVLTPSSFGVKKQSGKGASTVAPVTVDNTVLYVQDSNTRIRDLNYNFSNDSFGGNDLSIMAEHLLYGYQITEMAFAEEPFGILWCVRTDGALLGLTYQREQEVWAWHQHHTDGRFESITSVREGNEDTVYAVVVREIGGVEKRYIERIESRDVTSVDNVFCVDSGLSYSGAEVTEISGLDHLEGKEVAVVADGNVVSGLTVESGAITLPRAASNVTAGLPYNCWIDTLDLDTSEVAQTLRAKNINISEMWIDLQDSRGVECGPIDDDGNVVLSEVKPRLESFGYGSIPLRSFRANVIVDASWNASGRMRVQQSNPMPMAILSVVPRLDVS